LSLLIVLLLSGISTASAITAPGQAPAWGFPDTAATPPEKRAYAPNPHPTSAKKDDLRRRDTHLHPDPRRFQRGKRIAEIEEDVPAVCVAG